MDSPINTIFNLLETTDRRRKKLNADREWRRIKELQEKGYSEIIAPTSGTISDFILQQGGGKGGGKRQRKQGELTGRAESLLDWTARLHKVQYDKDGNITGVSEDPTKVFTNMEDVPQYLSKEESYEGIPEGKEGPKATNYNFFSAKNPYYAERYKPEEFKKEFENLGLPTKNPYQRQTQKPVQGTSPEMGYLFVNTLGYQQNLGSEMDGKHKIEIPKGFNNIAEYLNRTPSKGSAKYDPYHEFVVPAGNMKPAYVLRTPTNKHTSLASLQNLAKEYKENMPIRNLIESDTFEADEETKELIRNPDNVIQNPYDVQFFGSKAKRTAKGGTAEFDPEFINPKFVSDVRAIAQRGNSEERIEKQMEEGINNMLGYAIGMDDRNEIAQYVSESLDNVIKRNTLSSGADIQLTKDNLTKYVQEQAEQTEEEEEEEEQRETLGQSGTWSNLAQLTWDTLWGDNE